MKITIKHAIIATAICALPAFWLSAQLDSQSDLRENPDMESRKSDVNVERVEYPPYIKLDKNHIELNGADWSGVAAKLAESSQHHVNIVHIGDSHLQADMSTAVTRARLGNRYGSAGRALVVPFKLAGTNEPVDYSIKTDASFEKAWLLKTPWQTTMGFTGVSIQPYTNEFTIEITAREPFDSIAVYYTGEGLSVVRPGRQHILRPGLTTVALADTCSAVELAFSASSPVAIHGFNLMRGNAGIAYHVIGNNGATYDTYNNVSNFAKDVAQLSPTLIIVSLGTNEAFGRVSDYEMKTNMRRMIESLKQACPTAQFLLTTPSECQRRTTSKGKRKRRRTSYAVNTNVKRLRNAIIEFGQEQGIPVYDFYAVAGGDGSSNKWLQDRNMNTDRIHLLRPGYTIQGHLFTDALEEAFDNAKK